MTDGRVAPPPGPGREEAQALAGLVALFAITAAWWALALWPVDGAPAWLQRTRYVCFGVAESGLPDASGWIGLVGGPLGMGAILVVGWGAGMRGLVRRARRSRRMAGVLSALALSSVLLVTAAGARVHRVGAAGEPFVRNEPPTAPEALPPETYPRLDRPAPRLVLTGHAGEPVDLAGLRGRPVLVTFAYAHCQTVCPLVVRNALEARAALKGGAAEPAVVIVTLDPWRDTPSRLSSMAASWSLPGAGAWVVGGAVKAVEATLDAWEVPRSRDPATGEVIHPSLTYVVDASGRLAYASTGGAAALISLLERL